MNGRKTVLLIGTCDTKGEEIAFMKDVIESENVACMVMDIGLMKDPMIKPDITRQEVAAASGHTLEDLIEQALSGRYEASAEELAIGAARLMAEELVPNGTIDGVVAIGGSMGTAITLKALRSLPIGFPKTLISTVALSDYVHPVFVQSDIILVQPISDFCSLNDWSKRDLQRAALSMASIVSRRKTSGRWSLDRHNVHRLDPLCPTHEGAVREDRLQGIRITLGKHAGQHHGAAYQTGGYQRISRPVPLRASP